jgi:Outer membrane protein beta-barrel domain
LIFNLFMRLLVLVLVTCGCLMTVSPALAQLRDELNLPDHDSKRFYLGIGFMYESSHLQVTPHPKFLQSDSVLSVVPGNTGGFGVSGMFTFRLSEHLEFRVAIPEFIFASNTLTYTVTNPPPGETNIATKQIPSLLLGFPAQIKFLSDRIGNFRVYMLGGINNQYDLASNSSARKAQDLVKLKPWDQSIEAGVGFQFYFPVFILTPELKVSEGIKNIHDRDPSLQYSNVIDKLKSRMIVFSLIFEG